MAQTGLSLGSCLLQSRHEFPQILIARLFNFGMIRTQSYYLLKNLATNCANRLLKFKDGQCKVCTMKSPNYRYEKKLVILIFIITALFGCSGGATDSSSQTSNALIGINISAPLDYEPDLILADAMKTARKFTDPVTATAVSVDADGWPNTDFETYVWDGQANVDGTYSLSFTGKAAVSGLISPSGNISSLTYDGNTNTTTGTITINGSGSSTLRLTFTNTQRSSSDVVPTGVTNIKLMRPIAEGSSTSYPTTTVFTTPIQASVANFSAIRYMDWTATNWNQQVNWSDRTLPSRASYNYNVNLNGYDWQGEGGPWEYVVMFSNLVGKDAWINIPVSATDAYITNLANLFKYGSDGVNPYTSPQSNPVYPPLNSGLHVYIEYSNEVWNGSFSQFYTNCNNASLELAAGNAPINWDGSWDGASSFAADGTTTGNWAYKFCYREIAEHIVNISNDWRAVWGDGAMGTMVRPIFSSQYTASGGLLFNGANMLLSYYNNLTGNWVGTPHPPSYYIYGAGGAPYYNPETINAASGVPATGTAVLTDPGMTTSGSAPGNMLADTYWTTAMGVMHTAYEGGPNLITTTNSTINDAYAAAVADPGMTTDMVNLHNAWSANGGGLFVYYTLTGDYQWGFTPLVTNTTTPKMEAIRILNSTKISGITVGAPIPGSAPGSAAVSCSRSYSCNLNNYSSAGSYSWANYMFLAKTSASRTVTLTFGSATAAQVAVYVDGVKLGNTQSTSGGPLSYSAGMMDAGLHGVIVDAVAGSFVVDSISVN